MGVGEAWREKSVQGAELPIDCALVVEDGEKRGGKEGKKGLDGGELGGQPLKSPIPSSVQSKNDLKWGKKEKGSSEGVLRGRI